MWRFGFRASRAASFGALVVGLFGVQAALVACSGSSKRNEAAGSGAGGDAGRGTGADAGRGTGGAGGAAGSGGESGGGTDATGGDGAVGGSGGASGGAAGSGATSGAGGTGNGGTSGANSGGRGADGGTPSSSGAGGTTAGSGGTLAGSGGTAGDAAGSAGAGGATCLDLCTEDAPACCQDELRCASVVPTCRIDVLVGNASPTYMYEDFLAAVAKLSGEVELSITDADVVAAAAEPPNAARFEFRLSAEASATYGTTLLGFYSRAFRLSCDERVLYHGLFYIQEGAAAIGFPVIHVEADGETIVLLLGGWLGAWGYSSGSAAVDERERLDRPELRAPFCARGILGELDEL